MEGNEKELHVILSNKQREKDDPKERLTTLANLIVESCTHEEIEMLCVALLDANLKVKSDQKLKGDKG